MTVAEAEAATVKEEAKGWERAEGVGGWRGHGGDGELGAVGVGDVRYEDGGGGEGGKVGAGGGEGRGGVGKSGDEFMKRAAGARPAEILVLCDACCVLCLGAVWCGAVVGAAVWCVGAVCCCVVRSSVVCLSVWFLLTTRARRWAPPLAACVVSVLFFLVV